MEGIEWADSHAGCYIEGHRGWRGITEVLVIAETYGVEIAKRDDRLMRAYARFTAGPIAWLLADVCIDIANEYEAKLNEKLPDHVHAGWYEGEFFIMLAHWWEEIY